jgi:hypothetical protein
MGRAEPESANASNVIAGNPSTVTVKFNGLMPPLQQDPVTYTGDTDALAPAAPNLCPWPAESQSVDETAFSVATKKVTSIKSVTVHVHGPTVTRSSTFTITPGG